MIKKNKITFRSSLNLKTSLNSIRTIKINEPESLLPCHRTDLPKVLLGKFKTACDEYKNHIERLVVKMRVVVSVSCNISQQTFTKFCSSWYQPLQQGFFFFLRVRSRERLLNGKIEKVLRNEAVYSLVCLFSFSS